MKRLLALTSGLLAGLLATSVAFADPTPGLSSVVATCGTQTYVAGTSRPTTQTTTGQACTNATSGGPTNAAQGSTTSGQTGTLGMTSTTTSAPTYTTGTTNPQSTDTSGNTRTVDRSANTALGTTADSAVTNPSASASIIAALKGVITELETALPAGTNTIGATNQGAAAAITAGWPTINGEPADATGTFTNATQTGNVTTASVDGYGTALISINGTYTAATATFLASDDSGTTFYPIACSRVDGTSQPETGYTGLASTARAWLCAVQTFDQVRVLSSAVGSGTVNVRISQSSAPTNAPTQGAVLPDNVVDGVTGTSAALGSATQFAFASGLPVQVGSSNQNIVTTGYGSGQFQVFTNASGNTITPQGSLDCATAWSAISFRELVGTGATGAVQTTATTTPRLYQLNAIPKGCLRFQISNFVAGTTQIAVALARQVPPNVVDAFVGNTINTVSTPSPGNAAAQALTPVGMDASLVSNHVICAAACNSYGINVVNTDTAAIWVMAFNATSAPADGAVTPAWLYQLPASSTLNASLAAGDFPMRWTVGMTLVCSSTGPLTKTADAKCLFNGTKL